MREKNGQTVLAEQDVSLADRIHFRMMSVIHEDLYGVFRDPYRALQAAGLQPGQSVLEVGCGPGFFTVPAARTVGEAGSVCALDINPLAVEKVQRKVEEAGLTNVETVLADAAQTGLPDAAFDLVFLFGLARPIGGLDGIWVEMCRLLKADGILAVEGRLEPADDLFSPAARQGRISRFRKAAAILASVGESKQGFG
jgi:demethylmenaquinone methyltransferase/2-methoxy-6-polyprenyl-1,4-benzoquinol methylase